ncbi:hypothetical protein NAT51_16045 [Flavobacterium amniphilum]|uniref:hypothetical protein n=1 Tax=Flavobacterium amniphilum TaxID=1834035 RepID=UPI00202A3448|nr:hypothetical protein [Flavobacterium amniphilum]MCL9807047.1 hypothetical protein [Flavobacterium amniphilum]
MNRIILFSGILLLVFNSSCQDIPQKEKTVANPKDSIQLAHEKEERERVIAQKERLEEERKDSLYMVKFLNDVLQKVNGYEGKSIFTENYTVAETDNTYQIKVKISSGFFFSKNSPHLIIRRNTPNDAYIDVFSKTGKEYKKVLSHKQWLMTYTGDTLQDINGDGLKDFVVNWYGSSGCCLKGFSNVYLQRKDQKSFSQGFEFINPTFSPKEGMIRGICYGHPGETEMYKYKWNGEQVDTIEYVSYQRNTKGKTGKVMVSKDRFGKSPDAKIRNTVPKEYTKIKEYNWFTGKGY